MEGAKVALIQFQVSPPKTDIENNVIISDYAQMDRILKVGAWVGMRVGGVLVWWVVRWKVCWWR